MLDTGLVVQALQRRGHTVGHLFHVPENAGEWQFEVDGELLTLEQARALMEADDVRHPPKAWKPRKPTTPPPAHA